MSTEIGSYTINNIADKTFVGFRPEVSVGGLRVEIINDGNTAISLPQEGYINQNDYVNWLWTDDTIRFKWGDKGHLHMVIK